MPKQLCPRCGRTTGTSLACEYCGYELQPVDGTVEVSLPGGGSKLARLGRLRLDVRQILITTGILVATLCLCPQVWLLSATWLDHQAGLQGQYLSFANLVAAAVYVCPLLYALVLGIVWLRAWLAARGRTP
jgi:hypothetical protein